MKTRKQKKAELEPWIRKPEVLKKTWVVDSEQECCECYRDDFPCRIFEEGEYFCSEECARIFWSEWEEWEKEMEEETQQDEEDCVPNLDFTDFYDKDDDI